MGIEQGDHAILQKGKKEKQRKREKKSACVGMRPQSAPPVKQDGQPVTRSPNFPQHFRLPGQDRSVWICGRSVFCSPNLKTQCPETLQVGVSLSWFNAAQELLRRTHCDCPWVRIAAGFSNSLAQSGTEKSQTTRFLRQTGIWNMIFQT